MESPPAHQVNVQVENSLSAPRSGVDDRPISFGIDLARARQFGRNRYKVPEQRFVSGRRFIQRRQMFSRDNQEVNRRLGIQILKGHNHFIFKNNLGRDGVINDAAKNAVFQISLLALLLG